MLSRVKWALQLNIPRGAGRESYYVTGRAEFVAPGAVIPTPLLSCE